MNLHIEHWPAEGIVRIDLLDGPDDYGRRIAEGVTAHFRRTPEGQEDVLVDIEIEANPKEGRDVSKVDFEQRDENGNLALPTMLAQVLEELERRGLVEKVQATRVGPPEEAQNR